MSKVKDIYGIKYERIKHPKYKYKLLRNYAINTVFRPANRIECEFVELGTDGVLLIRRCYAWDGPSGPSIDTENFMRGSLVHDALYQLIEYQHLTMNDRLKADKLLRKICRQDGMSLFRAWYVYRVVRAFGGLYRKFKGTKKHDHESA